MDSQGQAFETRGPARVAEADNAARVSRLSVGLSVGRRRYSADGAALQLERLLKTPLYARRARMIGGQVGAEQGLSKACAAVEQALSAAFHSAA